MQEMGQEESEGFLIVENIMRLRSQDILKKFCHQHDMHPMLKLECVPPEIFISLPRQILSIILFRDSSNS